MSSSPTPIESNPCTEATPNEESETPNTQNQLSSPISECTGKDEVSDYLCEDKTQVFVQPKLQPAGNTYKPPVWAMPCPADLGYRFEVIKNGTPLSECTVTLSGAGDSGDATELSFCLFGRQPQPFYAPYNRLHGQCVALAHPSISRLHAVLQYGRPPPSIAKTSLAQPEAAGWYIQDLESTHGTFVNKRRLPSGRFVRIHVGHVVRFGGSTRLNVLQGPEDDTERESTLSWTELKQVHFAKKAVAKERTVDKTPETTVDFGCDWGLAAEDAAADVPSFLRDINGAACLSHENLYQDDPKRALRTYFEREGIDPAPEFEFVEASFGKQHCKIDLPLSSGTITAEAIVAGKRKEAIAQCALEACRLLDRLGEFDPNKDQSTAAKRIRTKAYWEEHDYYSSDEDTFTDRTGHVERKRLSRIRQLGVEGREAEEAERRAAEHATATCPYSAQRLDNATLLTVLAELEKVGEEIVSLEEKLEKINKEFTPQGQNPSELDELEAYMKALKSGAPSRKERLKLRSQLFTLRQREMRLFQQAGLPQPRQRVKLITTGGEEGEERVPVVEKTVRADAAAAVRAAKRKLQEDTGAADSHEVAPEQGPKNARLLRNEIKRSLAGHRTVQQSDRTRHVSEDQPFEVEEDDDEEVAAPTEQSTLRDRPDPNSPAVPSETDLTTSNKDELESITGPKMPTEHRIDGVVVIEHKPAVETASKPMGDNKDSSFADTCSVRPTLGPTIPSDVELLPSRKSRVKQPQPDVYEQADSDYVTWVPPTDQEGDGITALNAKFGY
ncbi:Kanadaptin [Clonorchis sinensis]|uniref:Kanadaptin n=1 Tax=Clonorchis sinensis TaxID=79923 RepID=A0A8T1LZJ2_CLOSI|nr:Kanadaptin [Clonorchis sinensis]